MFFFLSVCVNAETHREGYIFKNKNKILKIYFMEKVKVCLKERKKKLREDFYEFL